MRAGRLAARALLGVALAGSVLGALGVLSDRPGAPHALALAQAGTVAWLALSAVRQQGTWAGARFTVACAWAALFTVPALVLAQRPDLLALTTKASVTEVIAVTNVALFSLVAGVCARPPTERLDGPLDVTAVVLRPWVLAFWFALGVAGLYALFALNGGMREYLSNLDKTGSMNIGLLYVIFLSQFMRYAGVAAATARWSTGKPLGLGIALMVTVGALSGGLTGARAFIAIALVQLALTYSLLRRRVQLKVAAPVGLLAMALLIFGLGTVKRYGNYQASHPGTTVTLAEYARTIAPKEAVDAYVTNYADGLRLTGLALETVPAYAGFEGVTPLRDLASRTVPRAWRPTVDRSPVIQQTFFPANGTSLAIPLHATAYTMGGAGVIVLGFGLLGLLIGAVDGLLSRRRRLPAARAAVLIALVVQVPIVLRSGIPAGVIFLSLDVFAMWLVMATATRRAPAGTAES